MNVLEAGPSLYANNPRTSYIRSPVEDPSIRIRLTCAGAVGVPMPHHSVPPIVEIAVDPLKIRPSPQSRAQSASPVPSFRSQDSSATAKPGEQVRSSTPSNPPARALTVSASASVIGANSGNGSGSSGSTDSGAAHKIPESAVLWPFAEVFATRRPVHIPALPDYAIEGFELRGWGEPAREAIVIPIVVEEADIPVAVLVMGLNSRRPYDEDYANWIDLFRVSMNAMLTAVKGREADLIRAE